MKDIQVEIKDYDQDVHKLKVVLNMVGFDINYIQTDLLWKTLDLYEIKQGEFSVEDAVDVKTDWEKSWDSYSRTKIQNNKNGFKPKPHRNERTKSKKQPLKNK